MRRILLIALLTVFAAPAWAVQQGDVCTGELWRKVQAWMQPTASFSETAAYLRDQSIHYRVFDARPMVLLVNGEIVINPELYDAIDCRPLQEPPNCSIGLSQPRPGEAPAPTFASLPDLSNLVRATELISVDFDAEGKLIGYSCEVVLTGS